MPKQKIRCECKHPMEYSEKDLDLCTTTMIRTKLTCDNCKTTHILKYCLVEVSDKDD